MAHFGYVGLGLMGGTIVKRLLDKGHAVTGHNRTRSKVQWLEDAGMRFAETPLAVAQAEDIVFSMVTDSKALRAINDGPDGILAALEPGKIYVDMSTVSPEASRELAARVEATGAAMLSAPVSGSVVSIQQNRLSVMASGSRDAFERVKPILFDMGPKVTYVGGHGLALAMKIAVNLNLQVQMQAFCESVLLAEKCGVGQQTIVDAIGRETAVEVLMDTVVASPMVGYRGPFVLGMPDVAWFKVNMMQKDLNLAVEMGQRLDVPLPATAVCNEFLTAARGMGLADHDMAIVFDVLAAMAGLTIERSGNA